MPSSRRRFLRSMLALGGGLGLGGAMRVEGRPGSDDGGDASSHRNERAGQHYWNQGLRRRDDGHATPVKPRYHLLLFAAYRPDGPPRGSHRRDLERRLDRLEGLFPWNHRGVLFTVGYASAYFERFDEPLPPSVDLPKIAPLGPHDDALSQAEGDLVYDREDVLVHLASDSVTNLLLAEELLFPGGTAVDRLSGDGYLTVDHRRPGFVGEGLPHRFQDVEGIPDSRPVDEDAPEYMGFRSTALGGRNQATEDAVAVDDGRFAGATTQVASLITLDLEAWYEELSADDRVRRMFDAGSTVEDVGAHGDRTDGRRREDRTAEHAERHGVVGHAEKAARARRDGEPLLLRRDFDTVHEGRAAVSFVSLQRRIADFVTTRSLMNGGGLARVRDAVGSERNNGILAFIETERRSHHLIPPVDLRAFPEP